jgi:hypothetical protein
VLFIFLSNFSFPCAMLVVTTINIGICTIVPTSFLHLAYPRFCFVLLNKKNLEAILRNDKNFPVEKNNLIARQNNLFQTDHG